ncbi:MAG: hypothetical protein R3B95_11945 [Nitrospirales bacterium]|nr:hypothetical protein [Nitrospirales bacterium]
MKNALRKVMGILLFMGLSAVGMPVFAQVAVVPVDPEPAVKPFDLRFGYGYQANTDLKKSSGDFHRNDWMGSFNAQVGFSDDFKLDNVLRYEYHNYNFSNSSRFQWDNVHRFVYVPVFLWRANEHWTILGAPVLQWYAESGAKLSDAFTGGGLVGFNYTAGPDLSLGLAVGALSQIEDSAKVIPIPLVKWQFVEDWTLRVGLNRLGPTNGLGGEIGWKLAKTVELAGGIQYQRRRFRLDKNNAVGQETMAPVFAKVTWWMVPDVSVEFFGSVVTNGNLRLENKNGHKITDKDYDNTAYFGGQLHFIF